MGEVVVFSTRKVMKHAPVAPVPQLFDPVYPVLPVVVLSVICAQDEGRIKSASSA
jgi:hypothetical protein